MVDVRPLMVWLSDESVCSEVDGGRMSSALSLERSVAVEAVVSEGGVEVSCEVLWFFMRENMKSRVC